MYIASAALLLASIALAIPTVSTDNTLQARTATSKNPCPSGWTHYNVNFDDLAGDTGGKTHPVEVKNYNNLYWDQSYWQVISPGNQTVENSFIDPARFNMTAHSGSRAIVSTDITGRLATIYNGDYMTVRSFWIRHQEAKAFPFTLTCYVWPGNHSTGKYSTLKFNVPLQPYGVYTQISLTQAQQKAVAWAGDCTIKLTGGEDDKAFLIDDLDYCHIST